MSVDFPVAYPPSAAASVPNKTEDVLSLQQAFSAALRSRYAGQSGTDSEPLLNTITAKPPESMSLREKQIHDNRQQTEQQQIDRSYQTQTDRKAQNRAETQRSDREAGYEKRIEHGENRRAERTERAESPLPRPSVENGTTPKDHAVSSPTVPRERPAESAPQTFSASSGTGTAANASGTAVLGNRAAVEKSPMTGQNVFVSPMALRASPSQAAEHRVFSVFTLSGKWGQMHEKEERETEDDKEDSENVSDGLPAAKRHPFADLTAILFGRRTTERTAESPIHSGSRSMPPHVPPTTPKVQPKKPEPMPAANPQPLENLLNHAGNAISVTKNPPKETEPQQYIQRIAAACEHAAEHAAKNAPIRIKINLDHLGTLALRFFTKGNRLTMRFAAENKETADFLRKNLTELQSLLEKRNIAADIAFDVPMRTRIR